MTLKEYLHTKAIRPADFALQIGVSTATVYRMRNGSVTPEPETMRRIHELTSGDVRPDDFILARGGA